MRKFLAIASVYMFIALVSCCLFACSSKSSSDPTPATTTYSISGTVTLSGAGLQGVTMTLNSSSTATTDASGNYIIAGLSNGSYAITPSKTGYTFAPANSAQNVNGANITGVNFMATTTTVTTWEEYSANPIVVSNWNTTYDLLINDPCVINENGTYRMWFSQGTGLGVNHVRIYQGTSSDGINWTLDRTTVLLESNSDATATGTSTPDVTGTYILSGELIMR